MKKKSRTMSHFRNIEKTTTVWWMNKEVTCYILECGHVIYGFEVLRMNLTRKARCVSCGRGKVKAVAKPLTEEEKMVKNCKGNFLSTAVEILRRMK